MAALILLSSLICFPVAALEVNDRWQFFDLKSACDFAILVGVDRSEADLSSELCARKREGWLHELAEVAPGRIKLNEPDLVAAIDDFVKIIIVKLNDVSLVFVGRDFFSIGQVSLTMVFYTEFTDMH